MPTQPAAFEFPRLTPRRVCRLVQIIQNIRKNANPSQAAAVDQQTLHDLQRDHADLKKRYEQAVGDANRYQAGYLKARADYRNLVATRLKKATGTWSNSLPWSPASEACFVRGVYQSMVVR